MEQLQTVIRFLKASKTSTIFWLLTILMWILYFLGVSRAGQWLIVSAVVIFCLIMIIGSQKDKIKRLEEKLDFYKI
jgi:hypothetical protein